jgi:ABC-type multidrug transport system fused ATPase/permease subunit
VLQDPFLFTGTLAENIRFGNDAITDEQSPPGGAAT